MTPEGFVSLLYRFSGPGAYLHGIFKAAAFFSPRFERIVFIIKLKGTVVPLPWD
jgi:hypothetical protein